MKIAVLSRNQGLYSTRRLVEAGKEREHDMTVIDYLRCNVSVSQDNPVLMFQNKSVEGLDAVIPRIGASRTFYGSAVVRQFEMMHVFTTVKSQAIVRSRDKLRSMQILSRHGVGMPRSAFASSPIASRELIREVGGLPIVIKLLEGTQGKGVVLAETYKAAKSALDAFYGLRANLLIQEFVEEARGSDMRAFVINGKVVGAIKRTGSEEDFRSNLHQGGIAQPLNRIPKNIGNTAVKAAKALGLSIAGVDLLPSSRGPLVMEVNSSPGLEGIEKATGKNIAGRIIQYVEDNAYRKHKKDKVGV